MESEQWQKLCSYLVAHVERLEKQVVEMEDVLRSTRTDSEALQKELEFRDKAVEKYLANYNDLCAERNQLSAKNTQLANMLIQYKEAFGELISE
jgi:chromosome segregation ATPase